MSRRRGVGGAVGLVLVFLAVAAARPGAPPALPAAPPLPWAPGQSLTRDATTVSLTSASTRRVIFSPQEFILQLAPVRVPGQGRRLLVLTAEQFRGGHFLRSHLYLLDPDHPSAAVRLSPQPEYNFWDLSVGDVEGDGVQEVALCTWSHTARDPRTERRFFVYGWTPPGDLYPRWRGSRLCRPYLWARLRDVQGDGRAELVSVETALDGAQVLVAYRWNQFGFWGLGKSPEYRSITVQDAPGPGVRATVITPEGRREEKLFRLGQDALVP